MYTIEAITAVLGDERYLVKATRNGFQANLVLKGLDDDEKITLLYEGRAKLHAAGYGAEDVKGRLSAPPRDGGTKWTPWPCLFINKPAVTTADPETARAAALGKAYLAAEKSGFSAEDIQKLMRNLGEDAPAETTETPATAASEPDEVL